MDTTGFSKSFTPFLVLQLWKSVCFFESFCCAIANHKMGFGKTFLVCFFFYLPKDAYIFAEGAFDGVVLDTMALGKTFVVSFSLIIVIGCIFSGESDCHASVVNTIELGKWYLVVSLLTYLRLHFFFRAGITFTRLRYQYYEIWQDIPDSFHYLIIVIGYIFSGESNFSYQHNRYNDLNKAFVIALTLNTVIVHFFFKGIIFRPSDSGYHWFREDMSDF